MKFKIKRRWDSQVKFTCELSKEYENKSYSLQLGAAIKIAIDQGANLQGANLRRANLYGVNLYGVNLQGANLQGANLQEASLYGVNLQEADLWEADLRRANLRGTSLRRANLQRASLYGANLRGTSLREANLQGANLQGANLQGADLWEANLQEADLWGQKLTIPPTQILGYRYFILIAGNKMLIGCKLHNIEEWDTFKRDRISMMDKEAWDWWKEHKPLIMPIAKHHMGLHKLAEKGQVKE